MSDMVCKYGVPLEKPKAILIGPPELPPAEHALVMLLVAAIKFEGGAAQSKEIARNFVIVLDALRGKP